ncbi:MAG: hypothetical protein ABIE70_02315 [bacterium]
MKFFSPAIRVSSAVLVLLPGLTLSGLAEPQNVPPTPPVALSPTGNVIVTTALPTYWFLNAYDPDGDPIVYDMIMKPDSMGGDVIYDSPMDIPEGVDSTAYASVWPIPDNVEVFWRVVAFDGQTHSDWSNWGHFWVDAVPEAPTPPRADFPSAEAGTLYEMMPTFTFRGSIEYDPFDTIRYFIELATDSTFEYSTIYDSIAGGGVFVDFNMPDSLEFGIHYFWRAIAADKYGLTAYSATQHFWTWMLGDQNNTHTVDIADLIFLVHYMFSGGQPAEPAFLMDINGDCVAPDVADLVHLVQYMFSGGPLPRAGCVNASGML